MSFREISKGSRSTQFFHSVVLSVVALPAVVSCTKAETPTIPVTELGSGEFIPEATVREIMESMMAPSAESIWDSVAYISTEEFTIDAKPETDEDWQKLRRQAVIMAEAANALLVPGRRIGSTGEPADDPEHELSPDEMQAMIDKNRAAWVGFAHAMHAQAMETIRVIDAKRVDGLFDVGGTIDAACEGCHLQFWYPIK